MDLPDCPPGAEGYQDSVVEMPKKPETDESSCTKAEQEFQEHLNSLKIKLENGETRSMVERRGRDISGKWIYLCYPCGSVCSGESILQTHISGKKHKVKLSMRTTWPMSIFDDHPFNQNQKGGSSAASTATEKVLQKMAAAVEIHMQNPSDLDQKYSKYRNGTCHIQDVLDELKAPLVGLEYLVEHPPEQAHYEPSYICTLCTKQGHPRTIVNHLTCFWHRYNYLLRHFPKASSRLSAYKGNSRYREGVSVIMHRLTHRIEDKFGRLKPVNIEKEEFEKEKEQILQWLFKSNHFSEKSGITLEEVVDPALIESLAKSTEDNKAQKMVLVKKKDPSPPVVAAPSKPHINARQGRKERQVSIESLSDISDDDVKRPRSKGDRDNRHYNREARPERRPRYEPHPAERREPEPYRSRYSIRNVQVKEEKAPPVKQAPAKREPYKVKLAEEKRQTATESAAQLLVYHEKNPEKHPLYPEEWKKFWNRRYKEIQAEGKDPSKHDFKPEWIVFWTKRMKELHEEELQQQVTEIYRRMNLPPPDFNKREEPPKVERPPEQRRKSPELRRKSLERRDSREPRRRSPDWGSRRRSPEQRGYDSRHRSPDLRRRSPDTRRSPEPRRRTPTRRPDYRLERRTPDHRYSVDHRELIETRLSPPPAKRTRSRSPIPRHSSIPRRSPVPRRRSPSRTHIVLESARRSRSPLSRREAELRNRSPLSRRDSAAPHRNRSPGLAPSLQTVMISDDELKPDDGLSPWNSDNEIESISSAPRSLASSRVEHRGHVRGPDPQDLGPPENIVATLRVLVALEDYLGSLGPKIVDLLTEALKMEKERANSSEDLLERDSAVVLIETAKEKLKGAAQAGLVAAAAEPALRAAVLRAAATLHEADKRSRKKLATKKSSVTAKTEAVPVAGVGEVDRAQIAQQMAAALIAQGKTDVTSEELAQLVDAVVGMAEAKKREAAATKKVEQKQAPPDPRPPAKMSGTATALQLLQSAYDENDKKTEKEDAPDAMDGLSDSDLETLLKNFNELSAEEQHSLIAYLKKLEAREPQRVERLRQYVSAAATSTTPAAEEPPAAAAQEEETKPVTIESDDDDYTVEEVFQSATQKVKEEQVRKEMDIVKKSLESKDDENTPVPPVKITTKPIIDLSKHMSSASDLFALVQASIKSTSAVSPAANAQKIEVVASSTQPRLFGDKPEKLLDHGSKPQISPLVPVSTGQNTSFEMQDDSMHQSQDQPDVNRNYQDEQFNENDSYNQVQWNPRQTNNMPDNRGSLVRDQGFTNAGKGGPLLQDPGSNQFGQGPNPGPNQYGQGPNPGPNQYGQGSNSGPNQFDQGNDSGSKQFGQGSNQFGQGLNSGPNQFGQGPNSGLNQFGQGNNSRPNQFGQGNNPGPNQFGQGNNSGPNQLGQGNNPGPNQFGQGNNLGPNQFGQGNNSGPNQLGQGNNPGPNQYGQGNNSGPIQFGQGNNSGPNQFGQGNNSGPNQFGQGNNKPNQFGQGNNSGTRHFGQGNNSGPNQFGQGQNSGPNKDRQGNPGQNPSWHAPNQYQGQNQYNQGPRSNMNGRMGDNFDNRAQPFDNTHQQQFGNFDKQNNNNFRGRGGRGNFGGGPMRARGRGRY